MYICSHEMIFAFINNKIIRKLKNHAYLMNMTSWQKGILNFFLYYSGITFFDKK